jgi:taurine dioxygenase
MTDYAIPLQKEHKMIMHYRFICRRVMMATAIQDVNPDGFDYREKSLDELAASAPAGITLHHLSPIIGTEIHGIDLNAPINDATEHFLLDMLLQRKVIFFRDQDISVPRQMEICRIWGNLEIIDFLPQHPEYPEVLHIKRDNNEKGYENVWHSDVTWREKPSLGSMLRAVEVPEVGGDTMWSCAYSAYDNLPAPYQRACEGMEAVHSVANGLSVTQGVDKMQAMLKKYPPATHPVVRTHPVTGKKTIYVNRAHTAHLRKLSRQDSNEMLDVLYRQFAIPEHQCRFRWKANSIAFWDNRACQHYAISDYFPARREMYRVTIEGDKPF